MERKVTAAAVAAALVTILAWILRDGFGVEMSAEVQGAFTTAAVFLLGYLVPSAPATPATTGERRIGDRGPPLSLLLALTLVVSSCAPFQSPDEAFVRAERAHYASLSPVIRSLADDDPANDPDLSGPNGEALLLELGTWDASLTYQESRHGDDR